MAVVVVHPISDVDISAAKQYGDIQYINKQYIYGDMLDGENRPPVEFTKAIKEAVLEFNPEEDYLLIAGDHLQLIMAAFYIGGRCNSFRALRYDRQAAGYLEVLITSSALTLP